MTSDYKVSQWSKDKGLSFEYNGKEKKNPYAGLKGKEAKANFINTKMQGYLNLLFQDKDIPVDLLKCIHETVKKALASYATFKPQPITGLDLFVACGVGGGCK